MCKRSNPDSLRAQHQGDHKSSQRSDGRLIPERSAIACLLMSLQPERAALLWNNGDNGNRAIRAIHEIRGRVLQVYCQALSLPRGGDGSGQDADLSPGRDLGDLLVPVVIDVQVSLGIGGEGFEGGVVVVLDEVAAICHAVKINPGVDEALGYHLAHPVGDGVGDVNAASGIHSHSRGGAYGSQHGGDSKLQGKAKSSNA